MKKLLSKNTITLICISLLMLIVTRLVPHPPNFTALIAVAIYIPILCGRHYIFSVLIAMILTDIIIGFHPYIFWTWGSVILLGTISKYSKNIFIRLASIISGTTIYFIITNFGVWTGGMYGYNINGIISCYTMALPFLGNSLVGSIFYATILESLFIFEPVRKNIKRINPSIFRVN